MDGMVGNADGAATGCVGMRETTEHLTPLEMSEREGQLRGS